jgi:hypothetical protein
MVQWQETGDDPDYAGLVEALRVLQNRAVVADPPSDVLRQALQGIRASADLLAGWEPVRESDADAGRQGAQRRAHPIIPPLWIDDAGEHGCPGGSSSAAHTSVPVPRCTVECIRCCSTSCSAPVLAGGAIRFAPRH